MIRDRINDARVYTVGGSNSALYGHYWRKTQYGADRTPGTGNTEEHEYNCSFESRTYGYYKWYQLSNPNVFGWSTFSPVFGTPVWTSNDDLALIGKLREKVMQTSFNGGNFLGELPQTVGLLAGKVQLLANVLLVIGGANKQKIVQYRRGKRKTVLKKVPLKRDSLIANSWLEFSFGVLPLISDIYELAEIASAQNTIRARVKVKKRGRSGEVTSPWWYATASGTARISKSLICVMEQESLPTFWEQFGLSDPATIAWELLPWSFAVDWVLPVGKWVEAQSFARRMKGTFITTTFGKTTWDMNLNTSVDGQYGLSQQLADAGTVISVDREISNSLNVPLPSMKSSLLGGRPLERLANALSLVQQVFNKR